MRFTITTPDTEPQTISRADVRQALLHCDLDAVAVAVALDSLDYGDSLRIGVARITRGCAACTDAISCALNHGDTSPARSTPSGA